MLVSVSVRVPWTTSVFSASTISITYSVQAAGWSSGTVNSHLRPSPFSAKNIAGASVATALQSSWDWEYENYKFLSTVKRLNINIFSKMGIFYYQLEIRFIIMLFVGIGNHSGQKSFWVKSKRGLLFAQKSREGFSVRVHYCAKFRGIVAHFYTKHSWIHSKCPAVSPSSR